MPYRAGNKGRDDLYVCPECGACLDEEAIQLEVLAMLYRSGSTMNVFVVYVTCPECEAHLEAEIDAHLKLDNEVFSLLSEDDEPKDNQSNSYRHCGNCYQSWPCNCDDPVSICNICDGDQNDCQCGGYS